MLDVTTLQRHLPAWLKNALKPYYRTVFPHQLCIVLWVTFRCNYRCSYCPVVTRFDFSKLYGKQLERPAEQWIAALERLPKANLYFSGGEPFLFSDLPELINGLNKHNILGIVTNGAVGVALRDTSPRRST